ncbi:VWFA domain-containing protein [Caenorhabditis elegans]|uniref:VWFA domain-containing protein n=1 Tax=Caenorhabditis elegans TaxID=6239 RepID=G5EE24_CAEEL|nr:VWFA domain-containing protein [Caenorhabditis elegans]CAA88487.1 VWFA domain-containing protein [Caenorhabditis elegans]|eukprot:NP_496252.1 C-type LECtin [Caenorhabditis elegans]
MSTLVIFLTLAVVGTLCSPVLQNSAAVYADRVCQGDIKNLWLDVVVVVDKSQLMTNAQLWQVRNTITQLFGSSRIGPTKYPADPRSTCVGVVTYDSDATTNAQLDGPHSFTDLYNVVQGSLNNVDSTNSSYLSKGLLAAEQALKNGRSRTYRFNFLKVVIVFAADYQGSGTSNDAFPIARRMKYDNTIIITVACTTNQAALDGLAQISSPQFSLVDEMNTSKLVKQLTTALLSINCFCPENWVQFTGNGTQYGVCLRGFTATGGSYGYQHAIDYCASEVKNAHLANEFSQAKHDFMQILMAISFPKYKPLEYYIGLRNLGNQWLWEQPQGQDMIPLNPLIYSKWAPGFPQANSTNQVISTQPLQEGSTDFFWAPPQTNDWLFICQVQASSTEYYTTYLEN